MATQYDAYVDLLQAKHHWALEEISGTVMVDRISGLDGSYIGTIERDLIGLLPDSEGAVDFLGTGRAEAPHGGSLPAAEFSLSLAFLLNALPTSAQNRFIIVSKDASGLAAGDMAVWVTPSGDLTVQFQSSSAQFPLTLAGAVQAGEIYHLVVRAGTSGFDFWLDGVQRGSDDRWTGGWSDNVRALRLASVPWHGSTFLNGIVDQLVFFDRLLSAEEISGLMDPPEPPPPTNNPPVVSDDTPSTTEGEPVTFNVLDNDSDPDGDPLTFVSFTQPANGVVTDNGGGSLTYTPNSGFVGQDPFTYIVSDGTDETTGNVIVVVTEGGTQPSLEQRVIALEAKVEDLLERMETAESELVRIKGFRLWLEHKNPPPTPVEGSPVLEGDVHLNWFNGRLRVLRDGQWVFLTEIWADPTIPVDPIPQV